MDKRENSCSKHSTFSFCLFSTSIYFLISDVSITQGSLNQRNGHQLFNTLLVCTCFSALSTKNSILSICEFTEDFNVNMRQARRVLGKITTGSEVGTSLISKLVKENSISFTICSLQGTRIEGNSLIPSMDGVIIAVFNGTVRLAIIKRIFQLPNDIHPDVHVGSAFLDCLASTSKTVGTEVSIAIGKACRSSIESCHHPLVCVIKLTIVLVELFVSNVGAVGAIMHFFFCLG
mmetsp:Transcript_10763/g.17201  ORF Transcript_10763/g.17201 Transcript_10763/m.17201 type:complete len:233 (+) Transcript_10763:419-1117(+)